MVKSGHMKTPPVETFSMAMLESMAMRVPMIAPRIGGLPEAILHSETGFVFDVGNTEGLTQCLQSVIDNPELAVRMGVAAEEKVKRCFSQEQMVEGTEKVFRHVAGNALKDQGIATG